MDSLLNIEVVTPDKQFFSGQADMCVLRTTEGDIGVLYDHAPTVVTVDTGKIKIRQNGKFKIAACSGGFANIEPDSVVIVTDCAEWAEEIDVQRAQAACDRAKDRLDNITENTDVFRAQLALQKAVNRIRVAKGED